MTQNIRDKAVSLLLAMLKQQADPSTITDERTTESLGLSSLKLMNLMYDFEEAFDIELDPEEMVGLGTVGEIIAALEAKVAARTQAAAL